MFFVHFLYSGRSNTTNYPFEASFSPDSKYVFSGSSDGRIHVWSVDTGYQVCELGKEKLGPIHYVQFNPKYLMLAASTCNSMTFWLPNLGEVDY